jgi:hypothetical protein
MPRYLHDAAYVAVAAAVVTTTAAGVATMITAGLIADETAAALAALQRRFGRALRPAATAAGGTIDGAGQRPGWRR